MTNLIPYAIAWTVLAVVVVVLAIMRKQVASHEDDSLHLSGGTAVVSEQVNVAKKLESIDKWGKILTIILVLAGVALAIMYGMSLWEETSKVGF
jgi:hypothetical protein